MAKISVRILGSRNLSVALIQGNIVLDDLVAMRGAYAKRPTEDLLIIYRDLVGQEISSADLRDFAGAVTSQQASGRTGFVVDSDLEYGLTRLFEAYTHSGDDKVERCVFRSLDDAAAWLGFEAPALADIVVELEQQAEA